MRGAFGMIHVSDYNNIESCIVVVAVAVVLTTVGRRCIGNRAVSGCSLWCRHDGIEQRRDLTSAGG